MTRIICLISKNDCNACWNPLKRPLNAGGTDSWIICTTLKSKTHKPKKEILELDIGKSPYTLLPNKQIDHFFPFIRYRKIPEPENRFWIKNQHLLWNFFSLGLNSAMSMKGALLLGTSFYLTVKITPISRGGVWSKVTDRNFSETHRSRWWWTVH